VNEITCVRRYIVPCNQRGKFCNHRLSRDDLSDTGILFWCMKWRENNDKSKIINACDPDFIVGN